MNQPLAHRAPTDDGTRVLATGSPATQISEAVTRTAVALVPPSFGAVNTLRIAPGKKAQATELSTTLTNKTLNEGTAETPEAKDFLWISAPALTPEQLGPLLDQIPDFKGKGHVFRALGDVGKVEIRSGLLCVSSLVPVPPKPGEWKITFEPLTVVLGKGVVFSMGNGALEALKTFRDNLCSQDHEDIAKMSPACFFAGLVERYMVHNAALIEEFKGALAKQDVALREKGKLDQPFLLDASSITYDLEKMEAITRSYNSVAARIEKWSTSNQCFDDGVEEAIFRLKERTTDLIGQLDRREQKVGGLLGANSQLSDDRKAEVGRQIAIIGVPLILTQTALSYFQVYDFINGHLDVARLALAAVTTSCLGLYLYARAKKIL